MIRRLFERVLLGPGPRVGHQAYDSGAEDGEQVPEVVWLRHRVAELERALSDRDEAPTAPLPAGVIAQMAELEARNIDLVAEVTQLRKEAAGVAAERVRLDRHQQVARITDGKADFADQLLEEIRLLEVEVNRLRACSPATREELLRERETVGRLEERLAVAERRPHGRPYERGAMGDGDGGGVPAGHRPSLLKRPFARRGRAGRRLLGKDREPGRVRGVRRWTLIYGGKA